MTRREPTAPRASDVLIEVRDFSFAIGEKPILRNVSFSVLAGQYVSIIGPNGAGKTTLLRCLDGILRGGQGCIEICGRPLAQYRQKELARQISYVPQADGHLPDYSVEQFVLMGRYPYLSPLAPIGAADREAVAAAMARTGTAEFAHRALATLSGGERQKVFLAAALAQGATILLLDEPTTFLDYRGQAEIRRLLAELNRHGTTIIAVTHDVNLAAMESHKVVALRGGAVVFADNPAALMRPEVLQSIYDTPFLLVEHPDARAPMIVPRRAES